MSGDYDDDLCRRAIVLVSELCTRVRDADTSDRCQEFDNLRIRGYPRGPDAVSSSVAIRSHPVGIISQCLGGQWGESSARIHHRAWNKLAPTPLLGPHHHAHTAHHPPFAELLEPGSLGGTDPPEPSYLDMDSYPEAAAAAVAAGVKPSQTSPELPSEGGGSGLLLLPPSGGGLPSAQSHQQVTSLAPATRACRGPVASMPLTGLQHGRRSGRRPGLPEAEVSWLNLQVHRKTLNPVFNETFQFSVPLAELAQRKLHFSVYDFDRFSRHDLIGQVVLDNLLELAEQPPDRPLWRDIVEGGSEKADLGELNFSLCYLPTAGRLTVTIIKASNLKAMDLTGFSDPYVKASLISEGRRLKKRKTSIKKNTLNPTYNEALVFDVAPESVENVGLSIAVVDYDCIGHNEVIGVCRVGPEAADPHGREHWAEMLANPRKPVEHWHQLVEEKTLTSFTKGSKGLSEKENSE
ncbi:PREDICTED: synaptotagmin-3 [Condylura cristata]|uniref:synaptotagmin-3 n=1 Tax=Condylura cristata TaxID=143302 RepID=UPI000643499A|nr:PREDICTED: synaptotagmin-3 [Condylura cristata]